MCIIVDTNLSSEVFKNPTPIDFKPIIKWLFCPLSDGVMVIGGKLLQEFPPRYRRSIIQLEKDDRCLIVDDDKIDKEMELLKGKCISNDIFVLALARIAGARILCSNDNDLIEDFKNRSLISRPLGCVYKYREHHVLLRHNKGCKKNIIGR